MKIQVFFLTLGAVFLTVKPSEISQDKLEGGEWIVQVIGECHQKFPGVTLERIDTILAHKDPPVNREEKCLANCSLTGTRMMTVNKRIDIAGWGVINHYKWKDPEMAEKASEALTYCYDKVTDDDACEAATNALDCVFKRNEEMKIPLPDLLFKYS